MRLYFFLIVGFMAGRRRRKKNSPLVQLRQGVEIKKGLNFRRRRHKLDVAGLQGKVLFIVETVAVIVLAFLLVRGFGTRIEVIGESMEPTLSDGDGVLLNRLGTGLFSLKSGKLVAFLPGGSEDASPSIKRVIAVPHDTIRIENGAIYVNGSLYEEGMASDYIEEAGLAASELTLGDDEYFVLGDNRNNSQDSRYESVGNIQKRDMLGTVWFEVSGDGFGFLQ